MEKDKLVDKLSEVYQQPVKLWGPYKCKDGRLRVDLLKIEDDKDTTHLYAKVVLEAKLGRRLLPGETVDHIDEDKTNDHPDNLQPLPLQDNRLKSATYRVGPTENCAGCGILFELSRHQTSDRSRGKPGPFCSKGCASKKSNREQRTILERGVVKYERVN